MKKTFTLSIISTIFLAMIFAFSSCKEESNDNELVDGGNALVGEYIKDVENISGILHYDDQITIWYVEDENHAIYLFAQAGSPDVCLRDAAEGKKTIFSGKLYSVALKRVKEKYSQYKDSGIYVFVADVKGSSYTFLDE